MATTRRSQATLSTAEWSALIKAMTAIHGTGTVLPRYSDFVRIHARAMNVQDMVAMSWGVHTMGKMMPGRNFLAWHRLFLRRFEERLQREDPGVALPYWDWVGDPQLPAPLSAPGLLLRWRVSRAWKPSLLPTAAEVQSITASPTFRSFQTSLENNAHNEVHRVVGGTMMTASSPGDPVFWLHHANIDRLWAEWETSHKRQNPPNMTERLRPGPILNLKVSDVLSTSALGYTYQ